jgi:hypothetical protein
MRNVRVVVTEMIHRSELRNRYFGPNIVLFKICIFKLQAGSARALTPYPGGLNCCRSCTPASEDGLIEGSKHVRQK